MKKLFFMVVFILMVILNINSLYSVTKTINFDGSGDYLTFNECFTDLVTNGITEPLNVEVTAGTYVESATLNGTIPGADANNTVHIYPVGGDVIIDGSFNSYAIGLMNTAWLYLEGFEMKLDGVNEFSSGVLLLDGSTNIDISHCKLYDSGFVGLLAQNSQDIKIWNNFIYDTNAANISLAMCGAGANIEIWNNSLHYNNPYFGGFFGPPAQCIALTQSSANVHNNALHKDVDDNDPWSSWGIINIELMGGIMTDYYTADSFNNNCYFTVAGNKLFQVGYTESFTDLASLNTAYGFAANSVFGDPIYIDAANGDLNIDSTTSVCFDAAAVPARWFGDDINYETRTRWDIGADFIPVPALTIVLPDDFTFPEDGIIVEDFTQYIAGGNPNDLTLSVSGNTEIIVDIVDLEVTFGATDNWNGTETLIFTIDDNATRATAEDVVDIIVTPVNDDPTIVLPDNFTFEEDDELIVDFSNYVYDVDLDDLTLSVTGNTEIIVDIIDLEVTFGATDNWNGNETLTFTVDDDQGDRISFTAGKRKSNNLSIDRQNTKSRESSRATAEDVVDIIVTPVNDDPTIVLPDNFTFEEDGELIVDFSNYVYDVDPDDLTLSVSGNTEIIVDIVDLEVTFGATDDWNGTETLTFTIDDNANRATAEDVVDIIVTPVNDEPVLIGFIPEELSFSVMQDSTVSFSVEVEDIDSDLNYEWFVNDEIQVEIASEFIYQFLDSGNIEIKSITSDEEYVIEIIWSITVEEGSGVNDLLPTITKLYQNYPNPFNPSTTINYNLKENARIQIDIFNIKGQRIMTLVNQNQVPGYHSVEWNGLNDSGNPVSSGCYFYNLIIDNRSVDMKKCLLLK
ncbi:MAG: T9SS type A sorting domain-containing protein [Candidatus Cloacimonetes bacterium]|nr:T9SS type A sorting domain-containing protein [Candidatus Cloacimonadota bacterium]